MNPRFEMHVPEGVIPYPIPLREFSRSFRGGEAGRAMAALGALSYLLGMSEDIVRAARTSSVDWWSFDAGGEFARRHIVKHDLYSLPAPQTGKAPLLLGMQ